MKKKNNSQVLIFNHIDPKLTKLEVAELKAIYKFCHKNVGFIKKNFLNFIKILI